MEKKKDLLEHSVYFQRKGEQWSIHQERFWVNWKETGELQKIT